VRRRILRSLYFEKKIGTDGMMRIVLRPGRQSLSGRFSKPQYRMCLAIRGQQR